MEQHIKLEVPLGYRMVEKTKQVELADAEKILTTKAQKHYTQAIKHETGVALVGNYIVCPHCNSVFTANNKCSPFSNTSHAGKERVPQNEIFEWSDEQLTFFDKGLTRKLCISSPPEKGNTFLCPTCERESKHSEKVRHVEASLQEKKVTVRCEIVSIKEIFALRWNETESLSVAFPMYEIIVFDVEKGKIYIELENAEGIKTARRDITDSPNLLRDGAVFNAISFNKVVVRTVKRLFAEAWGTALPYCSKEITLSNLFKMTKFVGYDRAFYDYIPYKLQSFAVDESFEELAKQLHNSQDVEKLYKTASLPQVKSIRKIFFERAGLFFYLKEAERVFSVIKDVNLFDRFLKLKSVFEILSELHMRPGMMDYFQDLAFEKGQKGVLKLLEEGWQDAREAAIDYSSMCENVRKTLQKSWKKNLYTGRMGTKRRLYSIPMNCPTKEIKDCSIDGYHFFWLRNSNDYAIAGAKLENCLGEWQAGDYPVVCVKKRDQYVAAIEISENGIVQAYGYKNSSIEYDQALYAAFEKWMHQFHLSWSYDAYDFGENDEDDD